MRDKMQKRTKREVPADENATGVTLSKAAVSIDANAELSFLVTSARLR